MDAVVYDSDGFGQMMTPLWIEIQMFAKVPAFGGALREEIHM